jgi:hypothetical protein
MMLFTNFAQLHNNESPIATRTPSTSTSSSSLNDSKNKLKLKKDALEQVDYLKEYQTDPKYKTELCKGFSENGFCPYGNKCRFAHGRNELFDKIVNCKKYKQKECLSFFKNKYCCYGSRCHFKHEERKLPEIERCYHSIVLAIYNDLNEQEVVNMTVDELSLFNLKQKRLDVFGKTANCGKMPMAMAAKNNLITTTKRYLNQLENCNEQAKFTLSYSNLLPMF